MNIELEIKLAIHDSAIPLLKKHPLLQKTIKPSEQRKLISTYFDTPDKQLRKLGFALRIRQDDDTFVQTLKGRAELQAGITARKEWEWPLKDFALDFTVIPLPALQKLFTKSKFLIDFGPQFITDFMRTTWDVQLSDNDNTLIEIALDQGLISAGTRSAPIQEVEFELKNGNPEVLKAVANLFQVELGLISEDRSKAARGFALI